MRSLEKTNSAVTSLLVSPSNAEIAFTVVVWFSVNGAVNCVELVVGVLPLVV